MKKILLFTLLLVTTIIAPLSAQDSEDYDEVVERFAKVFNGDSEEVDENELFGNDDDEDNSNDDGYQYTLEFLFETEVTFANLSTGAAHTSIKFITRIEQDVVFTNKRWRTEGTAVVETESVGDYVSNQFFSCELLVEVAESPVDIMTRLNIIPETEDEDELINLAVQLKFNKSYKEDWYSNCLSSVTETSLTTIAEDSPENYNLQIIDRLEPALTATMIENVIIGDDFSVEFESEILEIEDLDTFEIITYTGSGSLTGTFLN